jgi:hypothetical protein
LLFEDFRKCDTSGDWMIQEDEAFKCFRGQEWLKRMPNQALTGLNGGNDDQAIKDLMKWTDRDLNGSINLNE